MMRIVVDMQGAQSVGSRNRGIGRYTFSLAKAIVRNRGEHEVLIVLSGLFPETIEPIRRAFSELLPQEHIRVWYAPGSVSHNSASNDSARQSAELIREAFIASLNPSIVLICSLFEGFGDNAVTSIGVFSGAAAPTAVINFDLIPLVNPVPYLENPGIAKWYESKLSYLKQADLLLSISESSRLEAILHLGISDDRVVNISTAADPQFRVLDIDPECEASIRERYGLNCAYVMYTGGIDHRKNIEGLIRAYAALPAGLRRSHQLAIVCSIHSRDKARLEAMADQCGLNRAEVILTGYVPEEDLVVLYNLCKAFIFPSWHEGFGLPALEAMSCRRAVIGSNMTSLPEVIGCQEALFDPFDDGAIAQKLEQVLTDNEFRRRLESHALVQASKFSWDRSARLAIAAMEETSFKANKLDEMRPPQYKPRLAFVSPLPPERSGISDYSAELLPVLSSHYTIDVVAAQDVIEDPWVNAHCQVRTVQWFRDNASQFDRVLYHFGNSSFHQHMFSLLAEIPGVVVLHDFYLSGVVAQMDSMGLEPGLWISALYNGHGYSAVRARYCAAKKVDVQWKYPCNYEVLQGAQGVIVHSISSQKMAQHWYGLQSSRGWRVIPHLRTPAVYSSEDRLFSRCALGVGPDDFVVCSFGLMGSTKLNHRLLDAWLASPLSWNEKCVLVFVGENDKGAYGDEMQKTIKGSEHSKRIRIAGWTSADVYRHYLLAADVGVQLRTLSRGETSGAVLDCMNHGLATIVNANGSMADLPDDGVWKLPDNFDDAHLVNALVNLWQNPQYRKSLGNTARKIVVDGHNPSVCAKQYFDAIEFFHQRSSADIDALIKRLRGIKHQESADMGVMAQAIALTMAPKFRKKQLLLDISSLMRPRARQSVPLCVVNVLCELLLSFDSVYRVEPVYADSGCGYRYARRFSLRLLECPNEVLEDDPVECFAGDIFLRSESRLKPDDPRQRFFEKMRCQGVSVQNLDLFGESDLGSQNFYQRILGDIATIPDANLQTLFIQTLQECLKGGGWKADEIFSRSEDFYVLRGNDTWGRGSAKLRMLRWRVELNLLNGLSKFSHPFSAKRAERFSRSARKRARRLRRNV